MVRKAGTRIAKPPCEEGDRTCFLRPSLRLFLPCAVSYGRERDVVLAVLRWDEFKEGVRILHPPARKVLELKNGSLARIESARIADLPMRKEAVLQNGSIAHEGNARIAKLQHRLRGRC